MHRAIRAAFDHARSLPEAYVDTPWGDTVVKVRKKIFLFAGDEGCSLKLPSSSAFALTLEGARPTAYGLGKAGWVSLSAKGDLPPVAILRDWVEESYVAVAPKTLARALLVRHQ